MKWGVPTRKKPYRRFVEAGLKEPPTSPFRDAVNGWLLGSQEFVDHMRERLQQPHHINDVPKARHVYSLEPVLVVVSNRFPFMVFPELDRDTWVAKAKDGSS